MCGEKNAIELELIKRGGSPPHVRGKAVYKDIKRAAAGITPACAGKSIPGRSPLSTPGDHPRMCGEKATFRAAAKAAAGSPPHVRGKAMVGAQLFYDLRITPACAGKRG